MPFINIKLLEGRTIEEKRMLVKEITNTVMETLNIDNQSVFIFIEDLKKDHYGKNGDLFSFGEDNK